MLQLWTALAQVCHQLGFEFFQLAHLPTRVGEFVLQQFLDGFAGIDLVRAKINQLPAGKNQVIASAG